MADMGSAVGTLAGGSKTSSVGNIAGIIAPLILSLFGGHKSSPQNAAATTAQQNALALASLPPEIRDLLNIQTQNAKAAQPLYLNAINAQNALLPSWARGGSTGSTMPTPQNMGGTGTAMGSTLRPPDAYGQNANDGDKSAAMGGSDIPLSGQGVDNGLVPGNSLDPQVVMAIMGLLTGNPALGAASKFVRRGTTSDTNFTLV